MDNQAYYQWKKVAVIDGEEQWLNPWADPMVYEFAFDFMFKTPQLAHQGLLDFDVEPEESNEWILVRVEEYKVITKPRALENIE